LLFYQIVLVGSEKSIHHTALFKIEAFDSVDCASYGHLPSFGSHKQ
jgi:hypothetical protein